MVGDGLGIAVGDGVSCDIAVEDSVAYGSVQDSGIYASVCSKILVI